MVLVWVSPCSRLSYCGFSRILRVVLVWVSTHSGLSDSGVSLYTSSGVSLSFPVSRACSLSCDTSQKIDFCHCAWIHRQEVLDGSRFGWLFGWLQAVIEHTSFYVAELKHLCRVLVLYCTVGFSRVDNHRIVYIYRHEISYIVSKCMSNRHSTEWKWCTDVRTQTRILRKRDDSPVGILILSNCLHFDPILLIL